MEAPLFELRNVVKHFQGRRVLDLESLQFGVGEIAAIEGPNGAGKTTLLKILALLISLDQGRLFYRGREVRGAGNHTNLRREITLVAQDAYLFDGSVEKNVAYGLKLRGVDKAGRGQLVQAALDQAGLRGFGHRRVRGLSGGEGQRVALARALALGPRVLLLDEPFANLDPASAEVFERVIGSLPQLGCTVILVSHVREQARRLAGRIIALEDGRLKA